MQCLSQFKNEIEVQVTKLFSTHKIGDMTPDMINSAICNILREAEKYLPSSKFNEAEKPYWCPELKCAQAQARHFRSVWLQLGRPRGSGHKFYVDYKSAKRMFRRLQTQCIDKYENSIFDKLNQASHTDYGLFWKLLRSQGGSSFEVCNFQSRRAKLF